MKFTPEVIAALNVLRHAAENDFERHRINVLERDLTAPPKPEIIDENNQKFGDFFYRKQKGSNGQGRHYVENLPLHRAVWAYYNGEIPHDCQIHHIDENPENNIIENLQCLTTAEHRRLHNLVAPVRTFTCQHCGKTFEVRNAKHSVRFCSNACRDRYKYIAKTGTMFETRICIVCGKEFKTEKRSTAQTCCRKCTASVRWNRPQEKISMKCNYCGKEFTTNKNNPSRYCSDSCRAKKWWRDKNQLNSVDK